MGSDPGSLPATSYSIVSFPNKGRGCGGFHTNFENLAACTNHLRLKIQALWVQLRDKENLKRRGQRIGVANVEMAEVGAETGSEGRYQTQRQC
jgi:hypothetical protein